MNASDWTAFEGLRRQLSEEWPNIVAAQRRTADLLEELKSLDEFSSEDTSIVFYGSMGRGEVTERSDADWALLVDGPSDPNHPRVIEDVRQRLEKLGLEKPGQTETFGVMADSHELLHHIAGTRDTNQNLTRRVLLLVESRAITQPRVRERVLLNVLDRYIVHDTVAPRREPPEDVIPHFLLNDVVRYWRTMATDYAAKMFERQGQEWALRNLKLRFSRKLIFMAGLLHCFSFQLEPPANRKEISEEDLPRALARHILTRTENPPIEVMARTFTTLTAWDAARGFFAAYDQFLGILADENKRARLKELPLEKSSADDPVWQEGWDASGRFRKATRALFFDDPVLGELMVRYGVF